MKKFLMALGLLFLMPLGIKAINVEVSYIDNVYSNRPIDNKILSGPLGYIYVDGNFSYCLDPSLLIITGDGNYTTSNTYLKETFKKEDIDYFNLVAYFGYEFENHHNEYYYMAAQELIWERIYNNDFYWTDKQYPNGSKIDIEKYKNEIESLVKNRPFNNQKHDIKVNEELIIEDEFNILKYYDFDKIDNLDITKEDNKLIIKAKKAGNYEIKLNHKNDKKQSLIYVANGYQTIATLGSDINLESSLKINVVEEPKEVVIEDILPNTSNTNFPKKTSPMILICLGIYLVRKKF